LSSDMYRPVEEFLSLSEAAATLPGRPHVSTVWRWVFRGVRGIKLLTIVRGGRRFTTHRYLAEFVSATTAAANGGSSSARTCRRRQRAIEEAERELEDEGI
jgi:hypothetical protein